MPDPRTHSGDLAQRPNWTAHQTITHSLRSLTATTPLGLIHLEKADLMGANLAGTSLTGATLTDLGVIASGLVRPGDRARLGW
ncbi:pentapeptide repeat-containing protein [Streptomyces avermitilis]|uniref:pentapeptide repeat-containing protein n=1 Tax=Streptomyces avermitilis TaxID=33903 RepID=UPI0034E2D4D7